VLGGFLLEGGNFLVLMQWAEFVIIGGAAAGALLISTPKSTLVKMVNYVLGSVKSQNVSRESLQELLQLLYEIFQTSRVKGLLTLEQHVEKPEESEIFSKYPFILKNHHTLEYLVDSLKLMVVGESPPLSWRPCWNQTWRPRRKKAKSRPIPWPASPTLCRV
jgi:chemotaxis protein MotA